MSLAPILLFTYKKLEPIKKVVSALQTNILAAQSRLIIFSDGPRSANDLEQIMQVREFLKQINGFKSVQIVESKKNMGLAQSIIKGVSQIIKAEGKAIVLEDDLVTSPNFLNFMNQALEEFKMNTKIHSISGYTVPIDPPKNYPYDSYYTRRASSWGWATWIDRWDGIDWEVKDYNTFKLDKISRKKFNAMGSDMASMLDQQMKGEINSWAIRWCYDQFKKDTLTVFPTISKICNIGFGADATHTKFNDKRFFTTLDDGEKTHFNLDPVPQLDPFFIERFKSKYSIKTRAYYKLRNLLRL